MLFKLALRNMRRSVKDYAIYFVTLVIAVIIFYAFNSISDQHIMHEIEATTKVDILEIMNLMMNMFSVVVSLVLGFLIIYANQLLVKRRKMEFGIYFTLGMKPGQVSRILLYETVLVGLVSLILGLFLGVLISQLLSFATAALFGISMSEYHFDFSMFAFGMTLLSFFVIYVVVAIFNVIMIHRCKLIDLLNASKKNQKTAIRNPWLCFVLFVSSLAIIGFGYWRLASGGLITMEDNVDFIVATLAMLIGTLLFFFSLAGFVVGIVTRSKGFYFRKLRPFTVRQVASKINTSFVSMWVVCVLLFLSLTTFSTGMNLVNLFTGDIEKANPYNVSILMANVEEDEPGISQNDQQSSLARTEGRIYSVLDEQRELVADTSQIDIYKLPETTYFDLFRLGNIDLTENEIFDNVEDLSVQVIAISQVNNNLKMIGIDPIEITDGEYAVMNNMSALQEVADAIVEQKLILSTPVGGLTPINAIENIQLYDFSILATSLIMAVPDHVIEDLIANDSVPDIGVINVKTQEGANEYDLLDTVMDSRIPGLTNIMTRDEMISQAMGLRVLLTYLAVYIGLVLLIATAAVLAIQLLSLTIDSLNRYKMLVKLGCDASSIKGSLFAQVVLFFLAPLLLAGCHCACAISVINGELSALVTLGAFTTGLYVFLLIAIYGGYMLVTYLASKSTIREAWVRA